MRKSNTRPDKKQLASRQGPLAGRGWAFALTALLHAGVLGLLLSHVRASPPSAVIAERPVVFVRLPSAILQTEKPASRPSTARTHAARRLKPRPVAASKRSPSLPDVAAGVGAASRASPPTPAAAPPMDADPDVPPPTAYLMRIARIISLEQKYPWSARQYDQQGDVIVRVHLMRDGRVLSVMLIRSSGYAALDDEARNVILRIARFPPFPFDYLPQIAEFDIDQPISFRHYLN